MLDNLSANFEKLNSLIEKLHKETNKRVMLDEGLAIANEFMHILGVPSDDLNEGDDALDLALPNSKFKNQKMEGWFEKHPYMGSGRVALYHYQGELPVESMFYQLSEFPRQEKISATTQLFPNWEDSELTMLPSYKVGIDFFLSTKTKALLVVLSKKSNLRVMELSERLTNTQKEILDKIKNIALYDGIDPQTHTKIQYEPQRTIHTTLWNSFELKEVNKKFYIGIADHFAQLCQHLNHNAPSGISVTEIVESAKIFSSRLIGRLLFIWFLKKKGIINEKMDYFNPYEMTSTEYYEQKLKKLFFDTLNIAIPDRNKDGDLKTPYLNGGLFEAHENDWSDRTVSFPEGWFVTLYEHLNMFNFTTDESSPEYEQVAIDPEMLGRVFENLLASIVPETAEAANERNQKGAFYTPREIVNYMCKNSLKQYLKKKSNEVDYLGIDKLIDLSDAEFLAQKSTGVSELWGVRTLKVRENLISILNELKVLDPACGSGAFPIGMLHLILKTYDRLGSIYDVEKNNIRCISAKESNNIYYMKLHIIRKNLYGCDIEPMAIEIARLRAWLSLIIDDKSDVEPLPNLDFNFVCANSLFPLRKAINDLFFDAENYSRKFDSLVKEYYSTHDKIIKNKLRDEFVSLYSENTEFSIGNADFIDQLKSWNPFITNKPANFFDCEKMFNVLAFGIVIGNPPYISYATQQSDTRLLKNRETIVNSNKYKSLYSKWDLYVPFIELGLSLLNDKGVLSMIVPYPLTNQIYAKKIREIICNDFNMIEIVDLKEVKIFDATVQNCIPFIVNEKTKNETIVSKITNNFISPVFLQSYENMIQDKNSYIWNLTEKTRNESAYENMLTIGDLFYVSKGMVLNSDETKDKGGFKKKDLISLDRDPIHSKKFIEGKDIEPFKVKRIRYLEWNTERCPNKVSRPTFEELYVSPKLLFNCLGELKVSIDEIGQYYCEQAIRVAVPWYELREVCNNSIMLVVKKYTRFSREKMEQLSKNVNMKYILGILNSSTGSELLTGLRGGDYHIVPEHIRKIPIAFGDEQQQKEIIQLVERMIIVPNESEEYLNLKKELDSKVKILYS